MAEENIKIIGGKMYGIRRLDELMAAVFEESGKNAKHHEYIDGEEEHENEEHMEETTD